MADKLWFPAWRNNLKKMHMSLFVGGTDVQGFSSQHLVLGFPIKDSLIVIRNRIIEDPAKKCNSTAPPVTAFAQEAIECLRIRKGLKTGKEL